MKHQALYIVRNSRTGALYTPVPVSAATANDIFWRIWDDHRRPAAYFVGYGIPYVGVFRR